MQADDSYGTCSTGIYNFSINKGDGIYDKGPCSQRQYAIWKNIDPLLNLLAWGESYREYNDKVKMESVGGETLEEYAKNNIAKNSDIQGYVVMWLFEADRENHKTEENDFYQHIMIGGRLEKKQEKGNLTINKIDSSCGHSLNGAKFRVTRIEDNNNTWIGDYTVNGELTITGLEPGKYYIQEITHPSDHVCSTRNVTMSYASSSFASAYKDIKGGQTTLYTAENGGTPQKGSIQFRKIDKDTKAGIDGIWFDLQKKANDGVYTVVQTQNSKNGGWVVFENVDFGEYRIRETDNDSKKYGDTNNTIYKTKGYTKNIGEVSGDIVVNSKNINVTLTDWENPNYGGLTIEKRDYLSRGLLQQPVTFKLYKKSGNTYIQTEYTATTTGGTASFWGNAKASEITTEYCILQDTYEIFETENKNPGYDITQDPRYNATVGGIDIGKVTIMGGTINTDFTGTANSATNTKYATLQIIKNGQDNAKNLAGAQFEITGKTAENKTFTTTITSSNYNQATKNYIKKGIPYGTYEVYETKAPTGYDIKIQEGYNPTTKKVYLGNITIADTCSLTCTQKDITLDNGNKVKPMYLDITSTKGISVGSGPTLGVIITNRKYINIQGYVWEDVPNTKANTYNSIYDGELDSQNNSGYGAWDVTSLREQKITNQVEIKLMKTDGKTVINNNPTISGNIYTFTKVDASQLESYYVVFDYSNYNENQDAEDKKQNQYITCVAYFDNGATIDISNTSKALINKKDWKISDENLMEKANTGNLLAHILGNTERRKVYYEYIDSIPTIKYINLGIRKIPDTNYLISQTMQKVEISVNNYSFTYKYDTKGVEIDNSLENSALPLVNWQDENQYWVYTREIYPSDIATLNFAQNESEKLKIKVTYKISITNNTNYNIPNLYQEVGLVIDSLIDFYDSNKEVEDEEEGRYRLDDSNWTNFKDLDDEWKGWYEGDTQWNRTGDGGKAVYTSEDLDVVNKSKTLDTYISFYIKDKAIIEMLNGAIYERFPTEAQSGAYHRYKRKDRYWNWSTGTAVAESEEKEHITKTIYKSSSAPYLKIIPSTDRKISGVVFKDEVTQESKDKNEVLGNGIYNNDDNVDIAEKKIRKVLVQLGTLDEEENFQEATLFPSDKVLNEMYAKDSNGKFIKETVVENGRNVTKWKLVDNINEILNNCKAHTFTNVYGQYAFYGVVPGEYYIRFTYGDGSQYIYNKEGKLVKDSEGNNIRINPNKYKSTIVSDIAIESAYTKHTFDGKNLSDQELLWYLNHYKEKDENGKTILYSSAVDQVSGFGDEQKVDLATLDNSFVEVTAQTPMLSVPIEFYTGNSASTIFRRDTFNKMYFGIIEKPEVKLSIDKRISNVRVVLQNAQTLLDGNPTQNIHYVADLDPIWSAVGSRDVKIELENLYMHGCVLHIEYLLTVTNSSQVTYNDEHYYKFGTGSTTAKKATVNILELLEYLDPNLTFESSDTKTAQLQVNTTLDVGHKNALNKIMNLKGFSNGYFKEIVSIDDTKNSNDEDNIISGTNNRTYILNTNINNENEPNSSTTVKVNAYKMLAESSEEFEYESYAQITKIQIPKNTYSIPTAMPIAESPGEAEIRITPPTGLNKDLDIYISATILLISLGTIIVCIKKIKQ